GASFAGKVEGPMLNSYLTLQKERGADTHHPLLAGFEDATRIINAVRQVDVKPLDASAFSPLEIVPTYPDLPMEAVFPPPVESHNPGVFLSTTGGARVVYFPGDIDRTFWDVL